MMLRKTHLLIKNGYSRVAVFILSNQVRGCLSKVSASIPPGNSIKPDKTISIHTQSDLPTVRKQRISLFYNNFPASGIGMIFSIIHRIGTYSPDHKSTFTYHPHGIIESFWSARKRCEEADPVIADISILGR